MKSGQVPIHIMRLAPADYVNDPFVRRCYQKRDYRTASFYPVFLFWCHMEGGDLPSDPEELAGLVLMPVRDVVAALKVCRDAGKVHEQDGRLYHRRVKREVEKELEFRRNQAELGKKGAQARINKVAQGKPEGSLSPPAPSPAPAPAPAPSPSSSSEEVTPPDEPTDAGAPPEEEDTGGIRCPRCGRTGSLMRERKDRTAPGWFCRTRRDGCGASIDLGHEDVLRQLTPNVRRSVLAELKERYGVDVEGTNGEPQSEDEVGAWFKRDQRPMSDLAESLCDYIEAKAETLTRREAIDQWGESISAPRVIVAMVQSRPLHEVERRREKGRDRSPPKPHEAETP